MMSEEKKFRVYVETASPQRICKELAEMVKKSKETEDVDWDEFRRVITSCTLDRAKQILSCLDYTPLMHVLMGVKGGPPKDIVETILNLYPEAIKMKDTANRNCLFYGIENNSSVDVMKLIVNAYPEGISERNNYNETPMHRISSITSLEIVKLLVENHPKITTMRTYQGLLPIRFARAREASKEVIDYVWEITQKEMPKFLTTFDELLEITTKTVRKRYRYGGEALLHYTRNSRDIDWIEFHNILSTLDSDTARQIFTYEANDDSTETFLSWIFGIEGGIPKNIIKMMAKLFPEATEIIQKWVAFYDLLETFTYIHNIWRLVEEEEDIDWVEFSQLFDTLDVDVFTQVCTCRDVLHWNNTLLLLLFQCKGDDNPSKNKIIDRIIESYPEAIKAREKNRNQNCLHFIIDNNSSSKNVVNIIINSFPESLMEKNNHGRIPLFYINSHTSLDIVKLIVEKNSKVSIVLDTQYRSVLQSAREAGASKEVIRYLLKITREEMEIIPTFPECLEVTHGGNRNVEPTFWGMTLFQYIDFLDACKRNGVLWEVIKHEISEFKKTPHVSGYDLVKYFVMFYTAKKGSGVSLLINWNNALKAEIMISHPWGEDIEETSRALNSSIEDKSTVIWFCIFANYQNEDGFGPSLTEQLSMEPFKKVISIPDLKGMVVVHSSKTELYDRKWCVHEIDEAHMKKVNIIAGCSSEYLDDMLWNDLDFRVDTASARCSRKSDEEMIDALVLSKEGGFNRLNRVIQDFREKLLERDYKTITFPPAKNKNDFLLGICKGCKPRPLVVAFYKDDIKDKGITEGCFVTKLELDDGTIHSDMTTNGFMNLMYAHKYETRRITFMIPKTKVKRENKGYYAA